MTIPLKKRGQVEVAVNGNPTVLHASFENIAAFEETTHVGLYALANRFGTGDVRLSDIVNLVWCFSVDRDKEGWTKDEIAENVISAGPMDVAGTVDAFLMMLFGMDKAEEAAAEATQKKPRARTTRSK